MDNSFAKDKQTTIELVTYSGRKLRQECIGKEIVIRNTKIRG